MADRKNLIPKQEAFDQAVAGGLNQSDTYRLVYEAGGMAPLTVWNSKENNGGITRLPQGLAKEPVEPRG